jgi:hypothetical protein
MHSGLDDEKSIDDRKPLSGAVMVAMMMAESSSRHECSGYHHCSWPLQLSLFHAPPPSV